MEVELAIAAGVAVTSSRKIDTHVFMVAPPRNVLFLLSERLEIPDSGSSFWYLCLSGRLAKFYVMTEVARVRNATTFVAK
jgi:hypothetical protein